MNVKLTILTVLLALLAGCASYSSLDAGKRIEAVEAANNSPSAIADELKPEAEKVCAKRKESWDYYWGCTAFNMAIGHALFVSGRYAEASDFIINYLQMNRASQEHTSDFKADLIQCNAMLYYTAESKKSSSPFFNARTALYKSLKAAGDSRAKDWLAMAYLCQSAYDSVELEPRIIDAEFLTDAERFWGKDDRREAEFYIKNVQRVIIGKRDEIVSKPGMESAQYSAELAIVYKNAYDYVVKNNMSEPYRTFLGQQYTGLSE
ncbi:hypothetical protein WCE02_06490 [Pseudomonas juntendi]|uniref:hypothetical protein n=1 Tax=Pseudomonas juntendi TaxID=2666183 RepID=UPI0034D600CE